MKIRTALGSLVLVASLLSPSFAQAKTSSGGSGAASWTSEISMNTKTSVFGKYAFTKGRTDVKVTGLAFLSKVSVTAKVYNATTKASADEDNSTIITNLQQATISIESGDIAIPGKITSSTKHSYSAVGASGTIPDMSIKDKDL